MCNEWFHLSLPGAGPFLLLQFPHLAVTRGYVINPLRLRRPEIEAACIGLCLKFGLLAVAVADDLDFNLHPAERSQWHTQTCTKPTSWAVSQLTNYSPLSGVI